MGINNENRTWAYQFRVELQRLEDELISCQQFNKITNYFANGLNRKKQNSLTTAFQM